jgi:hypothetical protein
MIVAMWHEQPRDFVCVLHTIPAGLRPGTSPVMNTDRLPLTCTSARLTSSLPAHRELARLDAPLDAP